MPGRKTAAMPSRKLSLLKGERNGRSDGKIDVDSINRSSFSGSRATDLVKQPSGRNNKGVHGRFRGAGFGQEFPNEKQKSERRKRKEETVKRQSPGARDTLTIGQVLIGVAASSFLETTLEYTSMHKYGKDFCKHSRWYRRKEKVILSMRTFN